MGRKKWKKLLGISEVQRKASRKLGIPLSRAGRRRKFGGCCVFLIISVLSVVAVGLAGCNKTEKTSTIKPSQKTKFTTKELEKELVGKPSSEVLRLLGSPSSSEGEAIPGQSRPGGSDRPFDEIPGVRVWRYGKLPIWDSGSHIGLRIRIENSIVTHVVSY